ncbi:MAG: membrane protease YdiL (CAAX protease family) [Paracoccaceae bacterium]|jgi:membrane protease YdiL (CAAX protease family)
MATFRHPLTIFSEAAKPRAQIWRTLLGIVMALAMVIALSLLMRIGVDTILFGQPQESGRALLRSALRETAAPSSTLSFLLYLATFAGFWPALWVTLRVVHKRSGATLWGPEGRINWRHFRIGLAISLALGAAAWMPFVYASGPEAFALRGMGAWLPILAVGLPLIFVQTAAEELLFRGYMLQQFAARTWSILGWSVLPSMMFAALHPSVDEPLGLNWFSFVFGLIMAAVTSRTANLGAAVGLHFGHNIINVLLIAPISLGMNAALISLPADLDIRGPKFVYIAVMFIGALIYMGRTDLKFLMAWREDPSRKGQSPIKLVVPLSEKFIKARRRRLAKGGA